MNNRTIQRVVILGAIAILFVIGTQAYWVMRTWNVNERDFDRTVNIALLNVAKELSIVNQSILPPQDLITRTSSNTYAVNINSQIDAKNLDFYLQKGDTHTAISDAKVTAQIQLPDGKQQSLDLKYDPAGKHYTVMFPGSAAGEYKAAILSDINGEKVNGRFTFKQ